MPIVVTRRGPARHFGTIRSPELGSAPCALARSGILSQKREGDGGTPRGAWRMRCVYYRPDRVLAPRTALPVHPITPSLGWCDERGHPAYNQPVERPFAFSHEAMAREDHLYDLCVVLGHNDAPAVSGQGSAIFLHLASPEFGPTEGCVAVREPYLRRLLEQADGHTVLRIF